MATLTELENRYFVADPNGPNRIFSGLRSKVDALIDGDNYLERLEQVIQSTQGAGDAIFIVGWCFTDDHFKLAPSSQTKLRDLLVEKHYLGVDVRLVFWSEDFVRTLKYLHLPQITFPGNYLIGTLKAGLRLRHYNPDGALEPPLLNRVVLDISGPKWNPKKLIVDSDNRMFGEWNAHHQKSVVVVAPDSANPGQKTIHGFVGGMDLYEAAQADVAHTTNGTHDLAVEVQGEAAVAVYDNFRTRWDEATQLKSTAAVYMLGLHDDLELPKPFRFIPESPPGPIAPWSRAIPDVVASSQQPDPEAKKNSVQLVQTFAKSSRWHDQKLTGGIETFHRTLARALSSAKRYVYIEDQYIGADQTAGLPQVGESAWLLKTVRDNVPIILVGGHTAKWQTIHDSLKNPEFANRLAVWRLDGGIEGVLPSINVHSKLVLIDDEFALIGSANFADRSMLSDHAFGTDTEISAAIVSEGSWVEDLRVDLWQAHLGLNVLGGSVRPELRNLDMALGIWNAGWRNAPTHSIPSSIELKAFAQAFESAPDPSNRTLLNYVGPPEVTP